MTRISLNGLSLAVHEWPGKSPRTPTVVCLHGLTANHACWESVADALAPGYRVIAYDLRGRGDSDKPETGYSLAAHGEDLARLLGHYGLKKAVLMGHSLGASIALRFAATRPEGVSKLVLLDGGIDYRAAIFDSIGPAVGRLGVEFPSLDGFLERMRGLPMVAGRWNDYLERYFRYDVETLPSGTVRAKAPRRAIEEEVVNLRRERAWVWHHRVRCPTLIFRAPDGLLTDTDCLMTQEEAVAMARAIPKSKLVVVPGTNHYTVLMGKNPRVKTALRAFLRTR